MTLKMRAWTYISLLSLMCHLSSPSPNDYNTSLPVLDDSSNPNSDEISLGDWDGVCNGPYEDYYRVEFEDCKTVAKEFDFGLFPKVGVWVLNPRRTLEAQGFLKCPYSLFFRGCRLTIDYWPKNEPVRIKRFGSTYDKAIEIAQKCTRYRGHSGKSDYIWGGYLKASVPDGQTVQVSLSSIADKPEAKLSSPTLPETQ